MLKPKSKTSVIDSYAENMPLTKMKQRLQQDVGTSIKDTSDSEDPLIEVQKELRA